MPDEINRLRALAGLPQGEIMDGDEVEDMDVAELDARDEREKKVVGAILSVCKRLGIDVETDDDTTGVYYDENDQRRAAITVGDYEIALEKLMALSKSGVGANFSVKASGGGLEIEFTVTEGLETAEMR